MVRRRAAARDGLGYRGFPRSRPARQRYARPGQINRTVLDYTGALKFIEQYWRLGPLADRDARSNSLISAFDFAASPRPPVLLHVGAAPDPLPVPHPLSHRQVTVMYLLYGGAVAVSILLLAFAALSSARWASRQAVPRQLAGPPRPRRRAGDGQADPCARA